MKSSGSVLCRARHPARLTKGESFLNGLQRRGKDSLCSDAEGKASSALQHAPRPIDDPQVVHRATEASLATKCQPQDPAVVEPRVPPPTSTDSANAQPRVTMRLWNEANSILARCKRDERTDSSPAPCSTFTFDGFSAGCRQADDESANGHGMLNINLTSTRGTTTIHKPRQPFRCYLPHVCLILASISSIEGSPRFLPWA